MPWYMEHTVLYVSNPQLPAGPTSGFQDEGARAQMMSETMGLIHRSEDVDVIHGAAYRALEMSNVPQYTQYPTHLSQEPVDLVSYPRTQRLGRPRRRGRGGRNVQEAGTSNWGPNFETGGGSGSGGNEDENFAGNFGGSHNVGTMFADANIVPNNDNTDMGGSWQSVLATACSEGFDVGGVF
ncbi:hypothetical protein HanXRQr2_Chr17g0780541 [Helianthus annuus]|uniref:Uncharacterized protein n=1 Tax=Helianthus annuus TaxID=4232 RepID=A0A9K3GSC4_HELAN|nr:hypothetical protein HanXRQr2_Chr17g0780541 [Helianthus annuus]